MKYPILSQVLSLGGALILVFLLCNVGQVTCECPCEDPPTCNEVCPDVPCEDGFVIRERCNCCPTCLRVDDPCDCEADCALTDCGTPLVCLPGTVRYKHPCDCCCRCWPANDAANLINSLNLCLHVSIG